MARQAFHMNTNRQIDIESHEQGLESNLDIQGESDLVFQLRQQISVKIADYIKYPINHLIIAHR